VLQSAPAFDDNYINYFYKSSYDAGSSSDVKTALHSPFSYMETYRQNNDHNAHSSYIVLHFQELVSKHDHSAFSLPNLQYSSRWCDEWLHHAEAKLVILDQLPEIQ